MSGPVLKLRLETRGYELGAHGAISVSNLLRYLEHQRWQTLTTDGELPVRRFWPVGVVRAQSLQIFRRVRFHEQLELSVWVSRVGRTSLDFSHELVRLDDGVRVALSTATVVALDQNRVPTVIDDEAKQYLAEGEVGDYARPTGQCPADAWERPVVLRPSDHDLQQHVNHARYADLVDDVRLLCSDAGGYGNDFDGRREVERFSIQYDQEARSGDAIVGRTWRVPGTPDDVEVELAKVGGPVTTRARLGLLPRG